MNNLSNTTIENNYPSQEELMEMYSSMSHEEILERLDRNILDLRITMIERDMHFLNFKMSMNRLNRTLDKFSN